MEEKIELCAGRWIDNVNGEFVLVYTNFKTGDEEFVTHDMVDSIYESNLGLPAIYKVIKRGKKMNISIGLMWLEEDGTMMRQFGELTKTWDEIAWKKYNQVSSRKNKGVGSKGNVYDQGLFELEKEWVKALEKKKYQILFPDDLESGNKIYSSRSTTSHIMLGDFQYPDAMLAKKFTETSFIPNSIIQPKFDGVRHLIGYQNGEIVIITRGKTVVNFLNDIREECMQIFKLLLQWNETPETDSCNIWLDGEFYCHGWKLQEIQSAVRASVNKNKTEKDIKFMWFDICDGGEAKTYHRLKLIDMIMDNITLDRIEKVEHDTAETIDDVNDLFNKYSTQGYEGIILRDSESKYVNRYKGDPERDWRLQKMKEFETAEAWIMDAEQASGSAYEGCVVWILNTEKDGSGIEFKACPSGGSIGNLESRKRQYKHRKLFIGSMVTYKYQAISLDGVPSFANVVAYDRHDLPT